MSGSLTETVLRFVDAAHTPLLAILVWVVWQIKTNDLPHIREEIALLRGRRRR